MAFASIAWGNFNFCLQTKIFYAKAYAHEYP